MRIWDVSPSCLCRQHLLGEHRELHALVTILANNTSAYRHHPETKRWEGKLAALKKRHEALVEEMVQRGYAHHSPIAEDFTDSTVQAEYVDSPARQYELLRQKACDCPISSG